MVNKELTKILNKYIYTHIYTHIRLQHYYVCHSVIRSVTDQAGSWRCPKSTNIYTLKAGDCRQWVAQLPVCMPIGVQDESTFGRVHLLRKGWQAGRTSEGVTRYYRQ